MRGTPGQRRLLPAGVGPWLPLGEAPPGRASPPAGRPGSMLSLYRRLLALRRAEAALAPVTLRLVHADDGVLAYVRG